MANKGLLIQEIIRKKRDGQQLTDAEIRKFVHELTTGGASDGQIGAFAMATFFKGMSPSEGSSLTLAMRDSGESLTWNRNRLSGPVVDKHSTGGVGDTVSLMLAPMLAACGAYVPMISGRGLGHTGGTLDKLSSIPGYDLQLTSERFQAVVEEIGCAIIGQTSTLAPADSRFYAVRDVTATVESVSLITASILSKKLAAGLDALVMDIKVGNGAFMSRMDEARALAGSINRVAHEAGLRTQVLITDMNQPLAPVAGNALEIAECVDYLRGDRCDARLHEVVVSLGSVLLRCSGLVHDEAQASERLEKALVSGEAITCFDRMVAALGGPNDFSDHLDKYLPRAPIIHEVISPKNGFVMEMDTRALGMAVVCLGGGRRKPTDPIDPSVGVDQIVRIGTEIREGDPICRIHSSKSCHLPEIEELIKQAVTIGDLPVASATPVIVGAARGADPL